MRAALARWAASLLDRLEDLANNYSSDEQGGEDGGEEADVLANGPAPCCGAAAGRCACASAGSQEPPLTPLLREALPALDQLCACMLPGPLGATLGLWERLGPRQLGLLPLALARSRALAEAAEAAGVLDLEAVHRALVRIELARAAAPEVSAAAAACLSAARADSGTWA